MGKGNDFWLDDPEWEVLRRKAEKRPIPKKLKKQAVTQRPQAKIRREDPRANVKKEVTEKEVVVNLKLSVPKVKVPELRHLIKVRRKQILRAGAALIVVIGVLGTFKLLSARQQAEEAKKPVSPEEQAQQNFNPLVPLEGLADATGKKVEPELKFDQEKKVLGLKTEYNGASLLISQQALPDQLQEHPGQLEGVARSINANIPIETQKGRAYIATDDETKSQVAVFATKELLVFIRANKTLDNEDWKFYINQLNPRQ